MISFILIAVLITVIAVLMLVWPLVRPVASDSYERHAQNIHFARERLEELEQQLSNAKITASDYEELKLEIETTLANDIDLADAERVQAEESRQSSSNAVVITLLCCLVPISAFVLYLLTGTPSAIGNVAVQSAENANTIVAGNNNSAAVAEISDLVISLENRLKQQPDDAQGWAVLARTYQQLGRYDEAIEAYQQLERLDNTNADTYAGLADATALKAGGILAGQPSEYVRKALQLNPEHPQALWLAGLAQAQSGQRTEAISYWQRLLPLLSEFPQQQAELSDVITQTKLAAANAEQEPSGTQNTDAKVAATSDSSEQSTATSPQQSNVSVTVNVSLSEKINDLVSPGDTVFVFARAKQGPPAPLAVKRLLVSDLPASVTLSETDAMMPQLTLAQFEDIILSARVAKSGNPIAQAGDLQSQLLEVRNDIDSPVSLTIENLIE